ncbi:MAG: hypothetical protein PHN85_00585, partial [Kiritimatiellae bacterium]|nr:hypothetical protein [Kiritimatiellia bacterium]
TALQKIRAAIRPAVHVPVRRSFSEGGSVREADGIAVKISRLLRKNNLIFLKLDQNITCG